MTAPTSAIPQRVFGWTGRSVPILGQGTWRIEHDPHAVEALRLGLNVGMTHIDTAEMYGSGKAEAVVGEAIAGRRDSVFLVSKVLPSNASYDGTLRACERSLKHLRTDYLDLYLLHWPGLYPLRETMRAFETLISDGRIRYLGVSNFDVPQLREAQAALRHERLACNQVLYHLGDRGIERKLLPYCAEHEIAVVGYSPFGSGKFPKSSVLSAIAERHHRTPRQVVLNFLSRRVFLIPKSGDPAHVRDNAGGVGWELTERDIAEIDRAFPAPDRDVPLGMI
jgi:diketogulonate reductase-like aldo/keto reductase